ncbi:MAG: hypothetical protein PHF99_04035 [Bacteroidales bacterium]|jgi:hypothetical protein|nr:hypothetical protein [Bacteroidales bacterium]MDY0160897.1 hypothetical protein [Bacteroidales bacterium]
MKSKISLIFIVVLVSLQLSYSQQFKLIEDSLEIKRFNAYIDSVLCLNRDTICLSSVNAKYRLVGSVSCPFTVLENNTYPLGQTDIIVCRDNLYLANDTVLYNILINNKSKNSNNASFLKKDQIYLLKNESILNNYDDIYSFNNYNFIILEKSELTMIGDYTSSGYKFFYILEIID